MAKKSYVGIGNQAKNIPKGYIGIGNVAKKIVKGYVGVGDVAYLFWGGGGVVPEYDYQAGQTYTIHNYFDAEKVMDICYEEFKNRATALRLPQMYSHVQYFIDHWQLIKELMLDTIESLSIDVTDISCVIYANKTTTQSSAYTYIALQVGDDTFPRSIKIQSISTDYFGENYYRLASSRPYPPTYDYRLRITAYPDRYEVSDPIASTGDIIQMGLWSDNSSSRLASTCTSFGLKEED